MQTHRLTLRSAFAVCGLAASLLAVPVHANAANSALLGLMKGKWTAVLAGNTGCGSQSVLATFALNGNGSGLGTATVVMHSTGCADQTVTSQDFVIDSINAKGGGTAHLTCGTGCGWGFSIQVADTGKIFILTDVTNPNNTPTGSAIRQIQ